MTLKVSWQKTCPGEVRTEIVDGVMRAICYLPDVLPPSPDGRVSEGLQMLYTFGEGQGKTVRDVSEVGTPLDLTVENEAAVAWKADGSLSVRSPVLISSAGPATKVIDAVRTSNELTIEAWVKPANNTIDGPARIVTLSGDPYRRNFTLAQGRWGEQSPDVYDVRLRTTETDENGQPSLMTPIGTLAVDLTHVVYTRAPSGLAQVYLNGVEVTSRTVGGNLGNWDTGHRLALANEVTGDRPWLGDLQLVAVYSRALSAAEVRQNFEAGADAGPKPQPESPSIISVPVLTAFVGERYVYDVEATGNPTPTYKLISYPPGMTIHQATGVIQWTPTAEQAGSNSVRVVARNGIEPNASQTFSIEVGEAQLEPPTITSDPVTRATVGEPYGYNVEATGHPTPTYALATHPPGMTIQEATGMVQWTPTTEQAGSNDVTVVASNGVEPNARQSFAIEVTGTPPEPPTPGKLLFDHNFESGDLRGFYWHQNAPEVVSAPHPVREGKYSMRSYLHRYQSRYSYRTEAIMSPDPNMPPDQKTGAWWFTIGQEYWIGLSIYIPKPFVADVGGMSGIVLQLQNIPDPGEMWRQPLFAIAINASNWQIWSKWDTRPFTPASEGAGSFSGSKYWLFPLGASIGNWTDWVINVKWSWQSDGRLKIWRSGSVVVDRNGPNCSNDQKGPYVQMGLYKWSWNNGYPSNFDSRVFYHDALRIGGADASYQDVAPRD
jgi:hypothetical protein